MMWAGHMELMGQMGNGKITLEWILEK